MLRGGPPVYADMDFHPVDKLPLRAYGFRMPYTAFLEGTQKISVRPAKLFKAARPRGEADCDLRGNGGSQTTLWVIMTAGECRFLYPSAELRGSLKAIAYGFLSVIALR